MFFFLIFFLLFVYFYIINNWCRGPKLSSVGDVHHDCCFYTCYESWFAVAFSPGEARGVCFPLPYMADLFLCWKCLRECFFQTLEDIWTLGELENNGLSLLISSTLLWKNAKKLQVVYTTETGNPATHKIVRFVALINYYAVNFWNWNLFLICWSK